MTESTNINKNAADNVFNAVIIGSGPASYTAALYLGRAGLHPIILAGTIEPGGALTTTTLVENYPGFPDGIQGPELMDNMQKQAEKFGAQIIYEQASKVELSNDIKTVYTEDGNVYKAKTVIISTGSSYRMLNVTGEAEYRGHGVSYCATCDGFFFKDKKILVVGGGDSAMTDADFLTRFSDNVTLVHRREGFRASKIMVDTVKNNPHVDIQVNTVVDAIKGDGEKVTSVTLKNVVSGEIHEMPIDGIFVAIGSTPQTAFLGGQVELDDHGYIKVEGATTHTSVPGVFAAGDVADPVYRQAISAAGTGCRAALDAQNYIIGH